MQEINNNILPINLYHGTSTIFLDSILTYGLGGVNKINELNLIDLSKEVYRLSEKYLAYTELFQRSSYSFKSMSEQSKAGNYNWQHGEVYLSPSKQTAIRYAVNKKYGSELLSYILMFLNELINLKLGEIKKLSKEYPKVFRLIPINPAPLLIQVKDVPISTVVDEKGENPKRNLDEINEIIAFGKNELLESYLQQTNFRLTSPMPRSNLEIWLINVNTWNQFSPKVNLYRIKTDESQ